MNGEAAEPPTIPESILQQSASPQNSREVVHQSLIPCSKSLSDTMDIRIPPRLPTGNYSKVDKSSSVRSCRSCSSFGDVDDTKRLLPKDVSEDFGCYSDDHDSGEKARNWFRRQETQLSSDYPHIERIETDFSCYTPTRRNTIAGKNGPIQYYVPSRGPEKGDAWFRRLVLQDKDPKTPHLQYTATAIKPIITSLGLRMKDVKVHSPIIVPSSSAEQEPPRQPKDVFTDAPVQTVLRLVRRETDFSCNISPLERQGTRRSRINTRSASLSYVSSLSKSLEIQPPVGRKTTEFSCHTTPSADSARATQDSESQQASQLEREFMRKDTEFSCNVPNVSATSKAASPNAQPARVTRRSGSQPAPQLGQEVIRTDTEFSCNVTDASITEKTLLLNAPVARKDTEFSCYAPDSQNRSLAETRVLTPETDSFRDPETSFLGVSEIVTGREKLFQLNSKSSNKDAKSSRVIRSKIEQFVAPASATTPEASTEKDHEKTQHQSAISQFMGLSSRIVAETEHKIEEFVMKATPFLPPLSPVEVTRSRVVTFQIPSKDLTVKTELSQALTKANSTEEEDTKSVKLKQGSVSILRRPSELLQPDTPISQISPRTTLAGPELKTILEYIPGTLPATVPKWVSDVHPRTGPESLSEQIIPETAVPPASTVETMTVPGSFLRQTISASAPNHISGIDTKFALEGVPKQNISETTSIQTSRFEAEAAAENPAERTIPTAMPTRIPFKKDSTVRNTSQKERPLRSSKDLRNVVSDPALRKTTKAPSLFAMLKKSEATSLVTTNTDAPSQSSETSNSSNLKSNVLTSEFVATTKEEIIKSPSIRTSSSKRSGVARHALLSPSITPSRPIDMGLPIPPMLSPHIAAALGVGSGLESLTVTLKHTESVSPPAMPNVTSPLMQRPTERRDSGSKAAAPQQPSEELLSIVSSVNILKPGSAQPGVQFAKSQLRTTADEIEAAPAPLPASMPASEPQIQLNTTADIGTDVELMKTLLVNISVFESQGDLVVNEQGSKTVDTAVSVPLPEPNAEFETSKTSDIPLSTAECSSVPGSRNELISEVLAAQPNEIISSIDIENGSRKFSTLSMRTNSDPQLLEGVGSGYLSVRTMLPGNKNIPRQLSADSFSTLQDTSEPVTEKVSQDVEFQVQENLEMTNVTLSETNTMVIPDTSLNVDEAAAIPLPITMENTPIATRNASQDQFVLGVPRDIEHAATVPLPRTIRNTPVATWDVSRDQIESGAFCGLGNAAAFPLPRTTGNTPTATRSASRDQIESGAFCSLGKAAAFPLPKTTGNTPTATRSTSRDQIESGAFRGVEKAAAFPLPRTTGNIPTAARNTSRGQIETDIMSRSVVDEADTGSLPRSVKNEPIVSQDNFQIQMENDISRIADEVVTIVSLPKTLRDTPVATQNASEERIETDPLRDVDTAIAIPVSKTIGNSVATTSNASRDQIDPMSIPLPTIISHTSPVTDNVSWGKIEPSSIPLPASLSQTPSTTWNAFQDLIEPVPISSPASTVQAPPTAWNAPGDLAQPTSISLSDSIIQTPLVVWNGSLGNIEPASVPIPTGMFQNPASPWNAPQDQIEPASIPSPESIVQTPSVVTRIFSTQCDRPIDLFLPANIQTPPTARNFSFRYNEPMNISLPASLVQTPSSTRALSFQYDKPTNTPLPINNIQTSVAAQNVSIQHDNPMNNPSLNSTVQMRLTTQNVVSSRQEPVNVPLPASNFQMPWATRTGSFQYDKPVNIPLPTSIVQTSLATRMASSQREPADIPLPSSIVQTPSATRKVSIQQDLVDVTLSARTAVAPVAHQKSTESAGTLDMNVEYWGFVPTVEGNTQDIIENAVKEAFQNAVQKVVQDAVLPEATATSEISDAYRRLIADSLDEAVRSADEHLRRSSQEQRFLLPVVRDLQTPEPILEEVFIGSKNIPDKIEKDVTQEDKIHDILSGQKATSKVLLERQPSPEKRLPSRSYTPSQYSGNQSRQDSDATARISGNKVALESYERLASESRYGGPPNEPTGERENSLWKAWNALSGSRRSSYAVVPSRPSSRVSPTQISRAPTAFRNLSLDSIKERPQESSSFDFDKDDKPVAEDVSEVRNSITKPLPTITRRRTSQWLRDMLSSAEPYTTKFTALPLRIERDKSRLQRSATAPVKSVEGTYLNFIPKLVLPTDQPELMGALSKTIFDVEQLLSEALMIARQALENDRADVIPVLENAAAVLRNGRPDLKIEFEKATTPDSRQLDVQSNLLDDEIERGSIHESNRSTYSEDRFSIGEDSDAEEEFTYYSPPQTETEARQNRIVIVKAGPTPTKSWAGWPPTGRAATPFPPSSVLESTPSIKTEEVGVNIFQAQAQVRLEVPPEPTEQELVTKDIKVRSERTEETSVALIQKGSVHDARIRLSQDRGLPEGSSENAQALDLFVEQNEPSREQKCEERKETFPKPPRAPSGREGRPKALPDKREVRKFIKEYNQPPIAPRHSSLKLRKMAAAQAAERSHSTYTIPARTKPIRTTTIRVQGRESNRKGIAFGEINASEVPTHKKSPVGSSNISLDGPPEGEIDLGVPQRLTTQTEVSGETRGRAGGYLEEKSDTYRQTARGSGHEGIPEGKAVESYELKDLPVGQKLPVTRRNARDRKLEELNLRGRSHVSLKEHHRFSLGRSKKRQPIARDWSAGRKRFVAAVNCTSTALIGTLIGIYAGEVPSIQYYLADLHHYSILGNVFLFVGISIPTIFLWPLPLLHGRKPYILASMSIAMPLLFPQAVAISAIRSPYVAYWRVGLLLPRACMGFVLGFANMNFQATLLDLFGASLRSGNPHGEDIDEFDVRRHGGGMGAWLGLWTWCYIGSIGIGFTVGAILINYIAPSWGMYISIIILLFISVLNVLCPEVRRGAYRRSVAEVKTEQGISRRVARGEVMMHRVQTGPKWFGQELYHGLMLSIDMLKQPGFLVLAVYQAWIYGQVVLMIVLLGSLTSNYYKFKSPLVGASVAAIPLGAMLAIPFERASLFSRSRTEKARTNSNTFEEKFSWKSHIFRRAIFTCALPTMGIGYTATSHGPPIPWILPILFAAAFGFLSNMTIAECIGIIMETWDTSDLQPGMTGRPRATSGEDASNKRTNYSSFPRVASAFGITQGLGFLMAAIATGVGGVATRNLGQQVATGVMAGILVVLTILFFAVLVRWQDVQIIPNAKTGEMDLYLAQRRLTAMRPPGAAEVEEPWRPTIIGNPKSKTRRMSIIELGSLTRWSEIRRKNRLYDETVAHPDREVLHQAHLRLQEKQHHVVRSVHGSLKSAHGSLRGRLSREGSGEGGGGGSRRGRKGKDREVARIEDVMVKEYEV